MVGHSNEADVVINNQQAVALLDSGSMVTTLSHSFFLSLDPIPELLDLSDFCVKGANDSTIPYLGYAVLDISVPCLSSESVSVPVLIVPDTSYTEMIPLIIGTNVTSYFKRAVGEDMKLPAPWSNVFSSMPESHSVPVKAFINRPVYIQPFQVCTVPGIVRGVHSMTTGVTEDDENTHSFNVCPRLVQVNPNTTFSKVPVRICNMSVKPVRILPKSSLCLLQDANVVRSVDPLEASTSNTNLKSKSLQDLGIDLSQNAVLGDRQNDAVNFLEKWKCLFSTGLTDLGCTNLVEHEIQLTDPTPFKEPYRRIPPGMFEEVREHLQDMLAAGAIRESKSPFSSNIVLVRKKDNSLRFCIDFRKLNSRTVTDAYSLPRIDETIDSLAGSKIFSKLDLRSGYWQVAMKESDKAKTAFSVGPLGFFECERMAFGLTNAPATFQRLMERCMGELHLKECLIYLDDIIIYSKTLDEHFERLEAVFKRLQDAGLKLKGSKCEFFLSRVTYLGHVVSAEGVETDPEKIRVLKEWPIPKSLKDLRSFLGFTSYYRRFVPGYASIAKPLNDLLAGHPTNSSGKSKKEATTWKWGSDEQEAFDMLIEKLTSPPILGYADFSQPFIINIDASGSGLGAVLYQEQDNQERVIAYASRALRPNERNYPVHKLEFLALKWAVVDKFSDYLYGNTFRVRTDNNPLTYVLSSAKLDATSHRWLAALSTFNFTLQYRSGRSNVDADFLSRVPNQPQESVVFNDTVKAIIQGCRLVDDSPVVECISMSQKVVDLSTDVSSNYLSDVDWKQEQSKDRTISRVIQIFSTGHKPTRRLAAHETESVRRYLREWPNLFLKEGVLFRHGYVCGHAVDQLVLPEAFHDVVFTGLHDNAGHQGIDRTNSLVKSRFFWPGLDGFVETRVRRCPRCIRRKTPVLNTAGLIPIHSSYPLELVCMDFLTLEMSAGGYENVLVMTDHFTHYAQAIPTKNQTARTTAKVLFENFICHYGFPCRLHSDQGRNFDGAVIKELCRLANIFKSRTTPYHPQGNGMPERFNQTLLNMLGTLEDKDKVNWRSHIPALVHAYNSTRHETTGLTPHYLMFGRHPRLALDAFLGIEPDSTVRGKKPAEYVDGLKKRLHFAYKVASREAKRQAKRHKKCYDLRVRDVRIVPGDRVLVRNVGLKGKCKLADRWSKDIYIVVAQPNSDLPIFQVKPEGSDDIPKLLHRNMLLPFMGLPLQEPRRLPADNFQHKSPTSLRSSSSVEQPTTKVSDKYVIPARRPGNKPLNPEAPTFVPRRTQRARAKPRWMTDDWQLAGR